MQPCDWAAATRREEEQLRAVLAVAERGDADGVEAALRDYDAGGALLPVMPGDTGTEARARLARLTDGARLAYRHAYKGNAAAAAAMLRAALGGEDPEAAKPMAGATAVAAAPASQAPGYDRERWGDDFINRLRQQNARMRR